MGQSAKSVRTGDGRPAVEFYDANGNITETRMGGNRPWRNNNPGNMVGGPGKIGKDSGGFAIFPDAETGRAAHDGLFRNDSRYAGKTIREMVPIHVDPKDPANDIPGYTKDIGDFSGLNLDRKIEDLSPEEYDRLMGAVRRREGAIDKHGNPLGQGTIIDHSGKNSPTQQAPNNGAGASTKGKTSDATDLNSNGPQGIQVADARDPNVMTDWVEPTGQDKAGGNLLDSVTQTGGLANEAEETAKAMDQAKAEGEMEQTTNFDSRIQSMRDLAAQPIDQPAQSALLKPVGTWTESEMKDVLNSAQGDFAGAKAGDPLKAHLYEKVQDWHTTNYGEGEQRYDGGKPVEPLPIRAIPEEPAPHLAKDGGDLWQASARMGDKLTGIAQTDGYEPSVKALQDGINMLNDANPPAERSPVWGGYTPQDRLKVDGDYGPKTDFALKSALADHGEDKVDGALSLGRFKGFAEETKGGDASGLGSMTTSLFGDDSGEALQRTLNRVGPDAVENWQPLEEDNQIGPMTTNAFASVMDSFNPGEFTQGFGEELGLL